jgi:hypothetical protein
MASMSADLPKVAKLRLLKKARFAIIFRTAGCRRANVAAAPIP